MDLLALPAGWRRIDLAEVDSTNAYLRRLIAHGDDLHEGMIVTAAHQTAGRGRQGRAWVSPVGNLHASILILPSRLAAAPEVGFVAAVAVADLIGDIAPGAALHCKWPNDVLVGGGKICGILPELATAPDGPGWIILGIGLNLHPVDVAAAYPVTSLSEQGFAVPLDEALARLAAKLAFRLGSWRRDGFGAIRNAWSALGPKCGATLAVRLPDASIVSGAFAGLDDEGGLLIETASGRRRILAGDVFVDGTPSSVAGAA